MRGAGGDEAISYIYDGDQIIAEYDASNNLITKYIYGTGIDEPIQGLSPTGTVPAWYYHFDGLGSVTSLTDSAGIPLENYSYDVYGRSGNTSGLGNRFMFTGREYDNETGLYYYRERYYSPAIGRFLQTDPLGATDENTYAYVYNNPVNWMDPYGLMSIMPPSYGLGVDLLFQPTTAASAILPRISNRPVINIGGLEVKDIGKPVSITDHYLKNAKGEEKGEEKKAEEGKQQKPLDKKSWWNKLKDLRIKVEKHPAHHSFDGEKKEHIQITIWQKGQKGSHKNYYFPL